MADGVGLSVGATNLAAVVVGRSAVTRSAVLTLYPHRPAEVGVPAENPNLNERGLVITDFVDRVGDPVGIVASDGSMHRGEVLLSEALRAMLFSVTRDRPPTDPIGVTFPAHWRPPAVDALRNAVTALPELNRPKPAVLVSDATAALTALQNDPGVPTRGVIALCDFGGTGTSVTLADAANGYQPIGPTVRHPDFSGDLIDQALLTHVISDLSAAGSVDLSSTSAIGSLTRLRAQCRGAKERLSTTAVTSLVAELPGYQGDVRLTRKELDDAIRQPLADFVGLLQDTVDRSGIRPGDLVAVASAGGGARVPIVTTTLSEHFRVPVITTPQPELTAAIGGGLKAVRPAAEEGMTSMAVVAPATAAAAALAAEPGDMAASSTFRALAWSDADDVPGVAPTNPSDYPEMTAGTGGVVGARPQIQFDDHQSDHGEQPAAALPWYRRPSVRLAAGVIACLLAGAAAVMYVLRSDSTPTPASTTAPAATAPASPGPTAAVPPPSEAPPQTQAPDTRTGTQAPPPPVTQALAPPPPTSEAPPPTTEAPPPPPPTTTEAPPPTTQPPSTQPPPTTQAPLIPSLPYSTIPGLPFVPAPVQGGG
jgi:hypothetical protein